MRSVADAGVGKGKDRFFIVPSLLVCTGGTVHAIAGACLVQLIGKMPKPSRMKHTSAAEERVIKAIGGMLLHV